MIRQNSLNSVHNKKKLVEKLVKTIDYLIVNSKKKIKSINQNGLDYTAKTILEILTTTKEYF